MELNHDQKVLQCILKKVWEDPEFKEKLIANPITTIESFTGNAVNVPEGKKLKIVDQTDDSTIYINLPAPNNVEDVELNEEQLDYVSGGGSDPNPPPIILGINNNRGNLF